MFNCVKTENQIPLPAVRRSLLSTVISPNMEIFIFLGSTKAGILQLNKSTVYHPKSSVSAGCFVFICD